MDKNLLRSKMMLRGEKDGHLSTALGLSRQGFCAKINGTKGSQFTQNEIKYIIDRYDISDSEIRDIFFTRYSLNKEAAAA